jgi:hypothetical protein
MGNFSINSIIVVLVFFNPKLPQKVLPESSNLAMRPDFTDFVISPALVKNGFYAEN